jgi:hypothetical protein
VWNTPPWFHLLSHTGESDLAGCGNDHGIELNTGGIFLMHGRKSLDKPQSHIWFSFETVYKTCTLKGQSVTIHV